MTRLRRLSGPARALSVSLAAAATDVTGLWLLHGVAGLPAGIAGALALLAAFGVNFTGQRTFTFGHRSTTPTARQLARFTGLVAANTAVTAGTLAVTVDLWGWHYLTVKLALAATLFAANYLVMRQWVFPAEPANVRIAAAEGPGRDISADRAGRR